MLSPVAARPSDLAEVTSLLAACALPHEDLTPSHLALFQIIRRRTLVAVVGLECFGDDGLVRSLAVTPEWRGQKLGRDLVAAVESSARQSGVRNLYLLTLTAQEFFAKRGYQVTDRPTLPAHILTSAEFVRLCPASAICMSKRLA